MLQDLAGGGAERSSRMRLGPGGARAGADDGCEPGVGTYLALSPYRHALGHPRGSGRRRHSWSSTPPLAAARPGPSSFTTKAGSSAPGFPPTSKATSATQTHWFRLADGKVIEHWANRDDMTMAQQLGWIPPSPRYLLRMILAKRKARTVPS